MSQLALRLVRSEPAPRPAPADRPPALRPVPAPSDPRELDDHELLGHFLPDPEAAIAEAGSLRGALELPFEQLARISGVDPHRYATLRTALELGRRFVEATIQRGEFLTSPDATRRALSARLRDLRHEVFVCLFLTTRHQVISVEEMFRGSIDIAPVYPREVAKRCLELNAAALVVAHNHVSGVADPSRADHAITKRLIEALAIIDVRLLDHFVIGDGNVVSFAEHGWI